jgi:hypothetical protein
VITDGFNSYYLLFCQQLGLFNRQEAQQTEGEYFDGDDELAKKLD